ncbi:MAG: hypothetical protein K2Y22_04300 [Candidatus Obscuribacterales bacterium]|nr:hypothetical protein [Candidatus Obscuribacterales bacterium]
MTYEGYYYHGGIPDLKVGAYLLPPNEQDKPSGRNLVDYSERAGHEAQYIRRDRVYVTTNSKAARAFAAMFPNGALYRVKPEGAVEIDPDCPDGTSLMCERAQIVQIADPYVKFEEKDLFKWMRQMVAPK